MSPSKPQERPHPDASWPPRLLSPWPGTSCLGAGVQASQPGRHLWPRAAALTSPFVDTESLEAQPIPPQEGCHPILQMGKRMEQQG